MLAWHQREKTTKPERQRARNQKTHVTDRILLMARTKKLSDLNEPEDMNLYDEPGTQRLLQPRAAGASGGGAQPRNELEAFVIRPMSQTTMLVIVTNIETTPITMTQRE